LKDQMSEQMMQQLSQHIGAEPQQTAHAAQGVFASLLGGLANNAATPEGLSGLAGALDRDHDGSIMDDLLGMVTGAAQPQNPAAANGLGILGHILGGNQQQVAQNVSQSSGLNMQQVMQLMPILAPMVMGMLGKLRNQGPAGVQSGAQAGNAGIGIEDLAGILMGSARSAQSNHGMGDLVGAVLGQVLGGGQQQQQQQQAQPEQGGGLFGRILGGLLKK
jgi:hypothetical protein